MASTRRKTRLPIKSVDGGCRRFRGVVFSVGPKETRCRRVGVELATERVGVELATERRLEEPSAAKRNVEEVEVESVVVVVEKEEPTLDSSDQVDGERKRKRRETESVAQARLGRGDKCCQSCGIDRAVEWRIFRGEKVFCNACGLRYSKYNARCRHCGLVLRKPELKWRACLECLYRSWETTTS